MLPASFGHFPLAPDSYRGLILEERDSHLATGTIFRVHLTWASHSAAPVVRFVPAIDTMNRTGWLDLMARVQPGDTIVVTFLDRFSRNFEEGVRIQAELTGRGIGIVAIQENIDTTDEGPAAKFFRRSMLAQGAYQVDSASERIKLGLGPGPWQREESWAPTRFDFRPSRTVPEDG